MRFSRKKSVTITDNITIPSQVLTAKEYDQSIGSMNNPANNNASKSHFNDAAIAKSAHTAKLRMLSKRAKRKSKKSILKNSTSSSAATTTKQKEGIKNSNKPKVSSNGASKASTPTTTTNSKNSTATASTMSITVNGKPILNIEPNATPEDVQTFLSSLQCGLNYELEQQKKTKKITNDDDNDEEDIQDGILPTSTSETEASEEEDVKLDDILPTTTSETEASAESRDSDIKLGPRATQKFEQMEKDMDAEVSLYDDKLGKSLRTLLEMKSKMSACGPMSPEGEEETVKATDEKVEELVSQVAQVVENVQETITDASKEVQSLIFPEISIQESSTVGSTFDEGSTLSDKSWKHELNGYRLTGQTSDIRLNVTNDDISVDPSIETIEKEGDILIGFDQHVRAGVVEKNKKKKQRQKSLVDPYQMSLILDGVAVQSLTLGAAAMKMINDMISDAKGNVTTCDVLNGGAEQEQLDIDLKNSLSVEENEVVQVQTPPPAAEEQDSSFIHPLILEKLNSFVEQAMVNIEHAKATTISTITSTSDGIQKAWREDNRNDNLSFERSTSEDDRDYSIDAHINF